MKLRKFVLLFAVIMLLFGSAPVSASAVQQNGVMQNQTKYQVAYFKVKITQDQPASSSSIGTYGPWCRSVTVERQSWSNADWHLWSYFMRVRWCFNNTNVTSVDPPVRWAEIYTKFWFFDGHIGFTQSGGAGQRRYQAWSQGKFSLCLGGVKGVGCVEQHVPWVQLTVYGNGNWERRSG